ncbi:hypothetical protein F2P81_009887 [Scophthalmus maximus]|uniref:Uncharacterized protein n=1 Tax=Scophthalmus maximus TaxID=52904 RepID=A0A6A4SSP5_SCOMX|nr:hypothetical protein F2P81_009887 [Scophthalmus maximus]
MSKFPETTERPVASGRQHRVAMWKKLASECEMLTKVRCDATSLSASSGASKGAKCLCGDNKLNLSIDLGV